MTSAFLQKAITVTGINPAYLLLAFMIAMLGIQQATTPDRVSNRDVCKALAADVRTGEVPLLEYAKTRCRSSFLSIDVFR